MAHRSTPEIEAKRQAVIKAREDHLQAKADAVRTTAQARAETIRMKAEEKASKVIAKAEERAARIEGIAPAEVERKVRLDVHGRPKPLLRGWIHAVAAPLALAAGIVLICLAPFASLKWACAVFMTCSLVLFGNSAAYHLGDWSPRVTDVLRRIDHMNIFLLIAGTYTPVSFALSPFWRNTIITGMWACTAVALIIHVIWINAPRWLYTITYIVFGVSGVAFMGLFWESPVAGPAVVVLLASGGACYIAGAIVYALRKPDPWPRVFGFHEIFHVGTVAGYACHMVAIYMVIVHLW
ncbi:PAQR family membrane homeostasis protein TrhA [Bifidobacterium vespertilionis]|uniref:Hemolysin III family protein n=1 Tax=Bifidobacterium vespertilionis TaxID=2562524 RepID=A0A5J5DY40_9BIFI|nr:hemolysin III family protein [Bifidobacterium vespertilionis]KAA8821652.1 hemolysin III family protein [Bifidobacterium vespertilionis]KAA8824732.1 hemolysin III family protein [Bifidobacterium vespertilionis]